MSKSVKVISENNNGRNISFKDCISGVKMSRPEFVSQIKKGNYDSYYVRNINGLDTPVSKPDKKVSNNLG